ncbi:MAG: hypothetical protein RBR35_11820 [Salinivirgaceae bacterium]|nr:hypothetical protein [Salinivirgaceae bacterium]
MRATVVLVHMPGHEQRFKNILEGLATAAGTVPFFRSNARIGQIGQMLAFMGADRGGREKLDKTLNGKSATRNAPWRAQKGTEHGKRNKTEPYSGTLRRSGSGCIARRRRRGVLINCHRPLHRFREPSGRYIARLETLFRLVLHNAPVERHFLRKKYTDSGI